MVIMRLYSRLSLPIGISFEVQLWMQVCATYARQFPTALGDK